jgi:hypothetical protein
MPLRQAEAPESAVGYRPTVHRAWLSAVQQGPVGFKGFPPLPSGENPLDLTISAHYNSTQLIPLDPCT